MHRRVSRFVATTVLCAYAASALAGGIVDNPNPHVKMAVIGQDSFILDTPSEQIPGFSVRLTDAWGRPLPGLTVSIFTNYYFCFNEDPTCTNPPVELFGTFAGVGSDEQLVTDADGTVKTGPYQGGTMPGVYNVHAGVYSLDEKNAAALHGLRGPGAEFDIQQTFPLPGALGGYMSGNWYFPGLGGGQGMQLEFTDAIDPASGKPILVAIWFVYTPDGAGQTWIYAQGTYDTTSNAVHVQAVLPFGAKFPPLFASADVENQPWGMLTFAFSDCDHGTMSWNAYGLGLLPDYDSSVSAVPIARLTHIAGTSCPQ
jgi:hypothetical protein